MDNKVTIITPTFYRNEMLSDAIESGLKQTYQPIEIIVVDDSGEKNAEAVVEQYDERVKYVSHDKNRGEAESRKTALKYATGEYIQFLDDDDTLRPRKIERQLPLLNDSEVGVVYCGASWPDYDLHPNHHGEVLDQALMFAMTPCCTPTMLFPRPLLDSVDRLARYPLLQDVWLIIEFARQTRFEYVDDVLVDIRDDDQYSLFNTLETAEVFEQIVNDYQWLYEQHRPEVRRRALSHTYQIKGHAILSQRGWSPYAPLAFWKAYRHNPVNDLDILRMMCISIFGKYGRAAARWASNVT